MTTGPDNVDRLYDELDQIEHLRAQRRTLLRNVGCVVLAWIALLVVVWLSPVGVPPFDQPKLEAVK